MLSPEQEKTVRLKIQKSGIRYYEVYQELCDHYFSAVEERMHTGSSFIQALESTHAAFGKEKGLLKLQKSFTSSAIKHYKHLHWQEFKALLVWPYAFYIAAAAVLGFFITEYLSTEVIAAGVILISLAAAIAAMVADRALRPAFWNPQLNRGFNRSLRGNALRKQAVVMIFFFNLLLFGGDVDWFIAAVDQLHHAFLSGLLVFTYLWCWSFYKTVRKTRPKLT